MGGNQQRKDQRNQKQKDQRNQQQEDQGNLKKIKAVPARESLSQQVKTSSIRRVGRIGTKQRQTPRKVEEKSPRGLLGGLWSSLILSAGLNYGASGQGKDKCKNYQLKRTEII